MNHELGKLDELGKGLGRWRKRVNHELGELGELGKLGGCCFVEVPMDRAKHYGAWLSKPHAKATPSEARSIMERGFPSRCEGDAIAKREALWSVAFQAAAKATSLRSAKHYGAWLSKPLRMRCP